MTKDKLKPMWGHESYIHDGYFVIGYMCITDYQCELGGNYNGNLVFPSVESLKENKLCASSCGIVEVKIETTRIVQQPTKDEE